MAHHSLLAVMKTVCAVPLLAALAFTLHGCGGGVEEVTTTPAPGTTPAPAWPEIPHEVKACTGLDLGTPPASHDDNTATPEEYDKALKELDFEAVKEDIRQALTNSNECWPADSNDANPTSSPNYGPFFIRLAWHCSGSYRDGDKKGGCAGGRQRFEPEASWEDNTNLDKARALLASVKEKYGHGLSWGDLFALAGTQALREMGTPIKQFCFGRKDNADGALSAELGPTDLQEKDAPCAVQGHCEKPLGSNTVGLIYLNPEGPVEKDEATGQWAPNPDPKKAAATIRDTFARMDHSDEATVALIGGGHAFGKAHGACEAGAGLPPKVVNAEQRPDYIPWPGMCGSGSGKDTFTSGFEGYWTTNPTKWDNEFFKNLLNLKWDKFKGPGGHWQWHPMDETDPAKKDLMRLTSDMALLEDEKYKAIVERFANDMAAFETAFDSAWTKLVTKSPAGSWSDARRCDDGKAFPDDLLNKIVMLQSDVTV